jgi:chromosome segregation ATPase
MDALQQDLDILGTHVQADATQVQDLSQSVLQLREAQEVMGSLLGKRGDEIIQQAGRLSERMNTVEAHQTGLTEQLQSNTQKTSTHLSEVNASLTSISQALDQTRQSLSSRLAKQEELGHTLNQTVQQFQQLKQDTQGQIQQMQSAGQVTDQLRKTVEQIRSRLHDLEIHQSGLVGKLDSDAQVTNTHMQEVNSGINSVAQALENVSAKLNGRIDDQEQRLNRAMTTFQRVQGTADTSQNNVAHLNKLTETVNQLREVVNTIGTKLGERVDQHEDRLGQLAQRVNRLQGPKQLK